MKLTAADIEVIRAVVRDEYLDAKRARPTNVEVDRAKTRRGDRHLEVLEVLRGPLLALCDGRKSTDPLFGDVDRHWVGYHVRRLCKAAGVPEVCPHGLRGTQASISVLAAPVEHVAAALGQTGPAVTRRHYLASGAEERGRQRAALKVIDGGKR